MLTGRCHPRAVVWIKLVLTGWRGVALAIPRAGCAAPGGCANHPWQQPAVPRLALSAVVGSEAAEPFGFDDPQAACDVAGQDQVVGGVDEHAPYLRWGGAGGGRDELPELVGDTLVIEGPPHDAVGVPGGEELVAAEDLGVVVDVDRTPGAELGMTRAVGRGEVLSVDH